MAGSIWVGINVTLECNRDCPHCFNKIAGRSGTGVMSDECINQFEKTFANHIKKYGHSKYTEFEIGGGEPLLVPDKTKDLITRIRKVSPDVAEIKLDTNTWLLDEDICYWCKENNIAIHFSINDNPLELVKDKLRIVDQCGTRSFIQVVLTDQNLLRLKEILTIINNHPTLLLHQFGRHDQEYFDLYAEKVPEAIQWVLDEGLQFSSERFYETISINKPKGFHPTLGWRVFIIEPDGQVGIYFHKNIIIGNIWDPKFDFIEAVEQHQDKMISYSFVDECAKCSLGYICGGGGGCQIRKIDVLNEKSPPPLCKSHKKVIPLLLEMKKRRVLK